ncbi:hypothetical protein Trydic_g13117 [Trypoxylus dichotomus]
MFVLDGLTDKINGTESDPTLATKPKAKLVLRIDPSLYVHVKDAKCAKCVWTRIKNLYEDTSFVRKVGLQRTSMSLRSENCENTESYIHRVIETAQKLSKISFEINEEWIGSLLLAGLQEKCEPRIMAVTDSRIKIDSDSIKTRLLNISTKGYSGQSGSAFATQDTNFRRASQGDRKNTAFQQKSSVRTNKTQDLSEIVCYKCKKNGHYMSKCPESNSNSKKRIEI